MKYQLKEKRSRTGILNGFLVAMVIVLISSLPYFHELIIDYEAGIKSWVPILGIEKALTSQTGEILGFSSYRVLLYTLFIFLFSQIGWTLWLFVSKNKDYHCALFLPVLLGWYQVIIILLDLRKTTINSLTFKIYFLLSLGLIFFIVQFRKTNSIRIATILKWGAILIVSAFPFVHDILTERTGLLRTWVPILGIEAFFADSNGGVLGFGNYRVFIYTLMLHLYAHLGWVGAFVYFNCQPLKKVRTFLLIPVILSFYSVIIIVFNWQGKGINQPDIKFYFTIALSILAAINYFFNYKDKNTYQKI